MDNVEAGKRKLFGRVTLVKPASAKKTGTIQSAEPTLR
jgi:hypothetical protein